MDRDLRRQRILATVDSIPRASIATYGEVAAEAGLPGRARLVARVLRELPAGSAIPWHRVVGAGGRIADHPGASAQRLALQAEGTLLRRRTASGKHSSPPSR